MNWEDVRDTLLTNRTSHPIWPDPSSDTVFNQTAHRIPATAPQTGGTPNGLYRDGVPGPFNTEREWIVSSGTTPENQVVFGEGGFIYWLASRNFFARSSEVNFAVGTVLFDDATPAHFGMMFSSDASSSNESRTWLAVRPVITLNSNVQWVEGTEGTTANPHRIR